MKKPLLISGIPSTGKSTFGNWLRDEHGFLHFDVENDRDTMQEQGVFEPWNRAVFLSQPQGLVEALRLLDQPVVLSWGFPVQFTPAVRQMLTAGVTGWWFTAPWDIARQQHARAGKCMQAFDMQRASLEPVQAEISSIFSPNIVETISLASNDPRHLTSLELAKKILNITN